MRDGKEGVRNEFRKSFHPAAFHRTQSGPNIDEKKDEDVQSSASLSAASFSPVRESSCVARLSPPALRYHVKRSNILCSTLPFRSLFVSGEMVFKGGSSGGSVRNTHTHTRARRYARTEHSSSCWLWVTG